MLAERLRKFRTDHNMTQQELADVLGVDRTAYTYYEIGKTTPPIAKLCMLAKIYHVSLGYLVGVEENHPELIRSEPLAGRGGAADPIAYLEKGERRLLMRIRTLNGKDRKEVEEDVDRRVAGR